MTEIEKEKLGAFINSLSPEENLFIIELIDSELMLNELMRREKLKSDKLQAISLILEANA